MGYCNKKNLFLIKNDAIKRIMIVNSNTKVILFISFKVI